MRNIFRRSSEFTKKHRHHHHLFLAVLALAVAGTGAYTFRHEIARAATYTFTQTSWSTATPASSGACTGAPVNGTWDAGTSECRATHASNQASWPTYTSASTTISIGANDISLLSAGYSFTDDGTTSGDSPNASGGGFSNGVTSGTVVSGTGGAASVTMQQSGLLTALSPATIAAGTGPRDVAISSSGTSVYVANNTSNTVSQYSRNTTTGLLTALSPATIAAASGPYGVVISPDGASVYVTVTPSNNVRQYSRNTTTGLLTALSPATIATGVNPYGITISPDGTSVYVSNNDSTVSQYSRNTTTGLLTALSPATIAAGSTPRDITISPDGTSVYVANAGDYTVSQYSRNTTTGLLTALSPATIASGWGTWSITISPDGTSVYAVDASGSTVSQYSRNTTTGLLTALSPATIATGASPYSITISPDGTSAYAVSGTGNTVYQYNRNTTTGLLTALSPATIAAGTGPRSITISPDGTSVYVANGTGNTVSQYSRVPYVASGTFTSATIDFARATNFTTMSWTSTTPVGTSVAMQVRSSPTGLAGSWRTNSGPSDSWDNCGNTTSGGNMSAGNCVIDTDRYIQYRATLSGTPSVVPSLDSVTINDTQYSSTGGTLTSSKYNTGADKNLIKRITWTGSATSTNETIRFQIRSSPDNVTWSEWCGYSTTCNGSNYFYDSPTAGFGNGVDIASDHPLRIGEDDQWFQYKVDLASGGAVSPVLNSVLVKYAVNAAPEVQNPTAVQNSNGTVTVHFDMRDIDTDDPLNVTPGKVISTLQYNNTACGSGPNWVDANTVSGDVGSNVTITAGYPTSASSTITWTPTTDWNDKYCATQQFRIKLNDQEGVNNFGYSTAGSFLLDTTVPAITTFNVAASSTPGTVNLTITDSSSPEYRLCDDSGYTTGCTSWTGITTATPTPVSKTLANNVNGRPEVYLQVRDAYGNTNSGSVTAPATPGTLLVADVANPTANYFGETLSWSVSTGATGGYKVWYATTTLENDTPPSTYTFLENSATNVYTHSISPTASTSAYWYRVTALSSPNGDISNFSAVMAHGDIPDSFGTGTPDTDPPSITAIATSSVLSTSAVITITTDEIASGRVYYGTGSSNGTNCDSYTSSTPPSVLYSTSTSITLTGLTPANTYFFCVKASDPTGNPTGNPSTGTDGGFFTTATGPTISSVTVQNLAGTSATIVWNTATSSDSYIYYSTSNTLANSVSSGNPAMVTCTAGVCQHQVGLSGLTADTGYYFKVKSTDVDENSVTDTNSGVYYYFRTLADTTAPSLVGDITTPVKSSTAVVIVWQTDEPASSQVNWGTASTSLLRFTVNDTTKSIYHVVTLSSGTLDTTAVSQELVASTPYYFTVKSSDAANNPMTSAVQSFTTAVDGAATITYVYIRPSSGDEKDTTPPVVSNVVISDITPFSAIVKFSTDEDTDGFVKYGKDTTYGDAAGDEVWAKTHTIKLRGLTLGTDYHIKVSANDKAGNTGSSADQIFKTTFLSENLKDMANIENIEQFQKEIESAIESILPSLVPPFITKPVISDITESGAKISFKSNIKAFPVVVFAEDGVFDETKENPYTGEVSDTTEKATSHEIALTGLKGNTKYHVQARGFSLPKVIGKSADVTFITKASKIAGSIVERRKDSFTVVWTTEQPTSSIVEYKDLKRGITGRKTDDAKKKSHSMKIENLPSGTAYEVNLSGITEQGNVAEAGSPLSVTTSTDTTPPTISGFKVDNALVPGRTDRIQTIVSWVTDEPSTSTAFYEEGAGTPGDTEELASKNEILDSYITNHSVILPSLKPGTIYRLKVTSTDDSGNEGSFGPRTVITPKQTESITDIIFKNFEDSFKFLQKI